MGIIQSLNAKRYNTFGEIAKDYFDNMLYVFNTTVVWLMCLTAMTKRIQRNLQKEKGDHLQILARSFR